MSVVRVSCQVIARASGTPVRRFQITVVSRWLAMPSATTFSAQPGLAQRRGHHPGHRPPDLRRVVLGAARARKCCRCSRWATATIRPERVNSRQRVDVVPGRSRPPPAPPPTGRSRQPFQPVGDLGGRGHQLDDDLRPGAAVGGEQLLHRGADPSAATVNPPRCAPAPRARRRPAPSRRRRPPSRAAASRSSRGPAPPDRSRSPGSRPPAARPPAPTPARTRAGTDPTPARARAGWCWSATAAACRRPEHVVHHVDPGAVGGRHAQVDRAAGARRQRVGPVHRPRAQVVPVPRGAQPPQPLAQQVAARRLLRHQALLPQGAEQPVRRRARQVQRRRQLGQRQRTPRTAEQPQQRRRPLHRLDRPCHAAIVGRPGARRTRSWADRPATFGIVERIALPTDAHAPSVAQHMAGRPVP